MKKGLISLFWFVIGIFQLIMGVAMFFVLLPIHFGFIVFPGIICVFGFYTIFCEIQRMWEE